MSNRLFLVCTAHPDHAIENACCLGERGIAKALYEVPGGRVLDQRLDAFFVKHEKCGTGPDHYALAHQFPLNHDLATPQSTIGPSVRLALVKGSEETAAREQEFGIKKYDA